MNDHRDLKRYRALLRDAQTMLEQKEKEGGAKAQIRQLKNQVSTQSMYYLYKHHT